MGKKSITLSPKIIIIYYILFNIIFMIFPAGIQMKAIEMSMRMVGERVSLWGALFLLVLLSMLSNQIQLNSTSNYELRMPSLNNLQISNPLLDEDILSLAG